MSSEKKTRTQQKKGWEEMVERSLSQTEVKWLLWITGQIMLTAPIQSAMISSGLKCTYYLATFFLSYL